MTNGIVTFVRTPSQLLGVTIAHVADGLVNSDGGGWQLGGAQFNPDRLIDRHPTLDLATFQLSDVFLEKIMRNCLLLSLIALLLGNYNLANSAVHPNPQSAPDQEEYAVYAALLKGMFMGKETKQLVIDKYTAVGDYSRSDPGKLLKRLSPLTKETADDFKARNGQPAELSDKLDLKVRVNFLSRDEIKRMFERRDEKYDGWKAFRQKYPGAGEIITLSRVGFSPDKSQALIFVGYQCDWLCGQGNYILFTKRDAEWKVEKKSMTWIS